MEEAVGELNIGVIQKFLEELPDKAMRLGSRALLAVVFFVIGLQLIRIIRKILKNTLKRSNADVGVVQFLDSFTKVSLYALLIFMIASSFGLDAASVVAVLGSAGVAIGLALQGSLSNFAGGVLILLLKPFKVGDYIIEDNKKNEGTVSEIQLFYTKLTTPDDKIIILPNGTLANTSLTNVTTTKKRRLDITIGISYDADVKQVKKILQDLLEKESQILKDMECFVYVSELAASSVVIGIRCWVLNEDYFPMKWKMTENIKEAFDAKQILIPYQQIDVHLKNN